MLSRGGKTFGVFLLVSLFLLVGWLLRCLTSNPKRLRQRQVRWTGVICRAVLSILRVQTTVSGQAFPKHGLIVANHLSYVDALVLYSLGSVVFVTSHEVRDSGMLGRITRCAGSTVSINSAALSDARTVAVATAKIFSAPRESASRR